MVDSWLKIKINEALQKKAVELSKKYESCKNIDKNIHRDLELETELQKENLLEAFNDCISHAPNRNEISTSDNKKLLVEGIKEKALSGFTIPA